MARKVVKHMVMDNVTQAEAMRRAGYSEKAINDRPKHAMKAIREEFDRILDEYIDPASVAKALREGIQATTAKDFIVQKTGEVVSGPERVDHYARVKHAELYLKAKGLIVRHEESKVTHEVDVATLLAARRRVENAVDVTPCDTVEVKALITNGSGADPLGYEPNESEKSEEKAKLADRPVGGNP